MEENKSKNGAGVVIVLIMAIIVIAVLGALIYVLQTNSNKEVATGDTNNSDQTINALKSEIDSLKNTIAQKENEIKNYENKEPVVQTKEMTADERFAVYAKGLKQSVSKFSDFGEIFDGKRYQAAVPVDRLADAKEFGIQKIELKYNGDLYLKLSSNKNDFGKILSSKNGTDFKVGSNIIKAGVIEMGQELSIVIYAIDASGNFMYCHVKQDTTKLEVKTHKTLKNIVEVQKYSNGETSNLLVATDIDGKMYDVEIDW